MSTEPKVYKTKAQQDAQEEPASVQEFKATPALDPNRKTPRKPRLNQKLMRVRVLVDAAGIISTDRNATHGNPEDCFANIARLWSAYLDKPVSPEDVCHLMSLLKIARTQTNPAFVMDNYVDSVGYQGIAGELRASTEGAE